MRVVLGLLTIVVAMLFAGCTSPDPTLVQRQAMEYAAKGDEASLREAAKLLADIDMEQPTAEVYALRLLCLMRTHQDDEALVVAGKALKLYPKDYYANYVAGKIYLDTGRYADALPFLEAAAEARPDDPNAALLRFLAACRADVKEIDFYHRQVAEMEAFKDDSLVCNEWALWYLRHKKPYDAAQKLGVAMSMPNAHPVVYRNMAVVYDEYLHLPKVAHRHYMDYLMRLGSDAQGERGADVRRRLKQLTGA